MKSTQRRFARSALSLAVRMALLTLVGAPLVASAQDDDVHALTQPTNYVELGAMNAFHGNQKFGEYNGLYRSGGYGIADFDLRGGDATGMGSGTRRWQVFGSDLGTTSRALGASVSDQGHWSLGFGFDQLRHYTTGGTFQTPFQGSMGGNNFLLPPDFGVINTTATTANGVLTSASKGAQTLTDNQLSYFHNEDVYTQRNNTKFRAGYTFDRQWNVTLDINHLDQSGAKLISSGTDAYNLTSSGGFNYGGERIAMLMNPTKFTTNTYNLALNWLGEKGHLTASYFVSLFKDSYSGLSWSNPFVTGGTGAAPNPATGTSPGSAFPVDTMATPPSNDLQQFNLTGGYAFSPDTRLAGGLSYSRNTQNQSFDGSYTATPNTAPVLPVGSLDGHVTTTHADLKLTHRASRTVDLNAGFKYNERDNRTASNTYTFLDLGGEAITAVNTPMSNRRLQAELAGDFRFGTSQHVHAGYEYEQIKRWCNNDLANNAQGELSATNAGYYTTASCVQVPKNTENRLVLNYRVRPTDDVNLNAGYTYAHRNSQVSSAFYNPMQGNNQGFENFGYLAFFDASRTQNQLKAGANWQPTDKVSFSASGRFTRDAYDSTLGVQTGKTSSLNLDSTYAYSDKNSVSAYVSWQKRTRDLLTANGRNAVAALPNLWTNSLSDTDSTLGIGARQTRMLHGKLNLSEDLTYSLSKTSYSTQVQYVLTGTAAIGTLSYGDTPDIKSALTQFKIAGDYALTKQSQMVFGYQYQRLKANDYYYNAYQYGYTPTTLIPTNQQEPSYSVNLIFVAYRYNFQ